MVIDFKDDIVDEDNLLQYFSYSERMEKFYPLMKKAQQTHASQKATFKIRARTCEFIVDKDGTATLRKKPVAGWW